MRTYYSIGEMKIVHTAEAYDIERLRAENARLREALEQIATTQGGGDCCAAYEWFVHTKQIARAALAALAEQEEK
jgi:hypothetical protein